MAKKQKKHRKPKKAISKHFTKAQTLIVSGQYNIVIDPTPLVGPGRAHVVGGQQIIWWNLTGGDVELTWPHHDTFGKGSKPFTKKIKHAKPLPAPGPINGDMKRDDPYIYIVIDDEKKSIDGNSPPDIIIE